MSEIQNKIKELENQIAELKEKERVEKEKARKEKQEERQKDLDEIKSLLTAFNKKYNDTLAIGLQRRSDDMDLLDIINWLAR